MTITTLNPNYQCIIVECYPNHQCIMVECLLSSLKIVFFKVYLIHLYIYMAFKFENEIVTAIFRIEN